MINKKQNKNIFISSYNNFLSRLLVIVGLVALVGWTQASPRTWQGEIEGVPTWITVVPNDNRSLSDLPADAWWTWGDAREDAYIFAFGTPEDVRLVFDFSEIDNKSQLSLYMNQAGAETVDVEIENNSVQVNSTGGYPSLVMMTEAGHWWRDGHINYNLVVYRDGQAGENRVVPDGEFDHITEVGEEAPGIAGWETRKLLNDPFRNRAYSRFGASVRMPGAGEFIISEPLMPQFPYFGVGTARLAWYERNPHPLYYDVSEQRLVINSMVGFYNGNIYRINSRNLEPNVDFESPFAMYNFEPGSRQTRLVIRAGSFPAGGLFGPKPLSRTRTSLRYSWKLFNDGAWAYGIHVAGPLAYEDEVTIGNHTIFAIEPERFPQWVVDNAWPLVTFVEPPKGYGGSEGIYFFSAQADEYQSWLAGIDNQEPSTLAAPFLLEDTFLTKEQALGLPPGFRGQYHSAYFREPRMYVSPIDRRLHLEHSLGGVWNLGEGRVMRYHNLDNDAYIDGWTIETITTKDEESDLLVARPGIVEEALYAFDDYLIYSSQDVVEIHRTAFDMTEFSLSPPTDAASWEQHKTLLADYREGRPVDNMRAWLNAFPGETLVIENASIQGMRTTDGQFHFTLTIFENPQVFSNINNNLLSSLDAQGVYALSYDREANNWQRQYATPARLDVSVSMHSPQAFVPQRVAFSVRNSGVAAWFGSAELRIGDDVVRVWENLLVPGLTTVSEEILWTPRQAGTLPMSFAADAPISMAETVYVKPTQRITFEDALWLPTQGQLRHAMMMLTALLLLVVAFWRTWNTA